MKTLRTKLIVICLLLLAIPSLVVGVSAYRMSLSELDNSGRVQLKNEVRLVVSMIATLDQEVKKGNLKLADAQERVKEQIIGKKGADGKRPITKRFDLGENGYFYVVDDKGLEIAHPVLEGKNVWDAQSKKGVYFVRDLVQNANNGGGYTLYDWPLPNDPNKSDDKIAYSEKDPNWGWVIIAGSYMTDYNKGASNVVYLLKIVLAVSLVLGGAVIWLFARRITRPIRALALQAQEVANGNLTVHTLEVRSRDEVGMLARAFSEMVGNIRTLMQKTDAVAKQVASSSQELLGNAGEVTHATAQIATTIQDVASGADTQVQATEESASAMEEMALGIQRIAETASLVSEASQGSTAQAKDGNALVRQAVEQMDSIHSSVGDSAVLMKRLQEHSQEIGQIVAVITQIAEQTNLLSLNAAIEAARAGENGRGFAVVADEVRKLAAQSAESASQISQLIDQVRIDTERSVDSMSKVQTEVQSGIGVVNETSDVFQNLLQASQVVSDQVREISAATEEMSAGSEQVTASVAEMSRISRQAATRAQDVSGASQQQLAAIEHVAESARMLNELAVELHDQINRFTMHQEDEQ